MNELPENHLSTCIHYGILALADGTECLCPCHHSEKPQPPVAGEKKCEQCLAHYTGHHVCDPVMKGLKKLYDDNHYEHGIKVPTQYDGDGPVCGKCLKKFGFPNLAKAAEVVNKLAENERLQANYVNSMTPEEQEASDKAQREAVYTYTHPQPGALSSMQLTEAVNALKQQLPPRPDGPYFDQGMCWIPFCNEAIPCRKHAHYKADNWEDEFDDFNIQMGANEVHVKDFIRQLLSAQKKEIVEMVESVKKKNDKKWQSHKVTTREAGLVDSALQDVLNKLGKPS